MSAHAHGVSIWIRNERWPCPVHVFNLNMFTVFRHQSDSDEMHEMDRLITSTGTLPPAQTHTHIGPLVVTFVGKLFATNVYKWPNVFGKTQNYCNFKHTHLVDRSRVPFTKNLSNHGFQLNVGFFKGFHLHTHTFGFVKYVQYTKSNQ